MYQEKPVSECNPSVRLVADEVPPSGQVWLITKYGCGYRGLYDKRDKSIVAWSPLPKLSQKQKERLNMIEQMAVHVGEFTDPEMLKYFIEEFKVAIAALDNECPDIGLMKLRSIDAAIDAWRTAKCS